MLTCLINEDDTARQASKPSMQAPQLQATTHPAAHPGVPLEEAHGDVFSPRLGLLLFILKVCGTRHGTAGGPSARQCGVSTTAHFS